MIRIGDRIQIDESELQFRFVRASGPGGQNVNKVSTAVELKFDALASPNLPVRVKEKLRVLAGRRMDQEGVILIAAQSHRTQERNRADAVERLVALIEQAAVREKPRIATKPTRGSRERKLAAKKHRGDAKRMRSRPLED
jgi:ribosome-associated protein